MGLNQSLHDRRAEIVIPSAEVNLPGPGDRDRRRHRLVAPRPGDPAAARSASLQNAARHRESRPGHGRELEAASLFAHELAQPLTAIATYVEACRRTLEACRTTVPDKAFECIEKAARESARAGQLIGRLRSLVEQSRPERRPTNVLELIEQTCIASRETIDGHHVDVRLEVEPALPDVPIDAAQVQLVLTNLVRNAVEAMETAARRQVMVKAARVAPGIVQVSVIDSGPGLDAETAARLFQPLASRKRGGLGIGLAICRAVIAAHGGRIWADARRRDGAAFHFTLPFGETVDDETDDLHR